MPILSTFYGLVVRMYAEGDGKHHTPHIHVTYQGVEYEIGLDGEDLSTPVLKGNRRKYLDVWMDIHKDELSANWDLLSAGDPAFRIDPLK